MQRIQIQKGDVVLVETSLVKPFTAIVYEADEVEVVVLTATSAHRFNLGEATLTVKERFGDGANVLELARALR